MNKAFLREPEDDGRAFCPGCGSLGVAVRCAPLDQHIQSSARGKLGQTAWFCRYPPCEVAYFDLLGGKVGVAELTGPVHPKSDEVPICSCFPFTIEEIEADLQESVPVRIRELVARSQTQDARCGSLAADGQCCVPEVRRIYLRLREQRSGSSS